jgi:hypothetical protein
MASRDVGNGDALGLDFSSRPQVAFVASAPGSCSESSTNRKRSIGRQRPAWPCELALDPRQGARRAASLGAIQSWSWRASLHRKGRRSTGRPAAKLEPRRRGRRQPP